MSCKEKVNLNICTVLAVSNDLSNVPEKSHKDSLSQYCDTAALPEDDNEHMPGESAQAGFGTWQAHSS